MLNLTQIKLVFTLVSGFLLDPGHQDLYSGISILVPAILSGGAYRYLQFYSLLLKQKPNNKNCMVYVFKQQMLYLKELKQKAKLARNGPKCTLGP